jgi:hypothetical protein
MADLELWVPSAHNTVTNPVTGDTLDLTVAEWSDLARIRAGIIEISRRMAELSVMLDSEMAGRLDVSNSRSISAGGYDLRVNAPMRDVWDVPMLMVILTALVAEGLLTKEAAQRAVKTDVTHKAVAREVNKLLKHDNPRVRDRIAEAHTTEPAPRRVTVTGGT